VEKRAWLAALVVVSCLWGCALGNRITGMSLVSELQKTGQPAEATILEARETNVTFNDRPVVEFRLQVRMKDVAPFEAVTRGPIPLIHIPQFQPGAVVPVLVDPSDHQRVALDVYERR
jgi:hypothetical protein